MMEEHHGYTSSRQLHNNSSSMEEGWVDSVVEVARTCNKLFSKHACGVCHIYVDKQVQMEFEQDKTGSSNDPISPVERAWLKSGFAQSNLEVDMYRQFLFDEDSVASGVTHRRQQEQGSKNRIHKDMDGDESIATHGTN